MENLQKDFLPYELALRMKALGFDEPCLAKYITSDLVVKGCYTDSHILHALFEENEICEAHVLVPTFSQTFRWFREKYQLHSTITSISQESWQWHITKPGESLGKMYQEDFYTYEEAELECLKKLIQIIENK
jgi:hypothetical protein